MNRVAILLCLFLAISPCQETLALHDGRPPGLPELSDVHTTLSAQPDTALYLGGHAVRLEESTLDDVVAMAGVGAIRAHGDAGESQRWVCYLVGSEGEIWFVSGELGGTKHLITNIQVKASSGARAHECASLPSHLRSIRFGNGLWLGNFASHPRAKLGAPSKERAGWWLYGYGGRVGNYDRLVYTGFHFQDGRIDKLFMFQATTN
jgi:hypothetical protein